MNLGEGGMLPIPATAIPIVVGVDNVLPLYDCVSDRIAEMMRQHIDGLEEIKIREGRPLMMKVGKYETFDLPLLLYDKRRFENELEQTIPAHGTLEFKTFIDDLNLTNPKLAAQIVLATRVAWSDIESVVQFVGGFRADGRTGINGTVHRISEARDKDENQIGVTIRVGRFVKGCAEPLRSLLEDTNVNILMWGPPGVGKSTTMRDMIRIGAEILGAEQVGIDTSGELGGYGRIPHPGIGDSDILQVPSPEKQAEIIRQAVANHGPKRIVVDEIGYHQDALVLETAGQRGCGIWATAHGREISRVAFNPAYDAVLGNPDSQGKRTSPCVFNVGIEIRAKGVYAIYDNLEAAIDACRQLQEPVAPRIVRV